MKPIQKCHGVLLWVIPLLFLSANPIFGMDRGSWQNHVTLYGWYTGIDATMTYPDDGSGSGIKLEASDILENLDMIFMGNYEGRYENWSFIIDAVYLDIGGNNDTAVRVGTASVDLGLTAWVLNGGIGYDFIQSGKGNFGLVGGVRTLSLNTDIEVELNGTPLRAISENESVTDGFIGVRGQFKLNDNWFLPYYADIGAGGSNLSYQLYTAIGYRYQWFDVHLGYRHLYFDLEGHQFMEDLQVSGLALGVGFTF